MSTLERDKAIFGIITKAYAFQFEFRKKLDSKLNNFIAITATIATLNAGIGFFVFDKIPNSNPFYLYLVLTFVAGMFTLVIAIVKGLLGYKPTKLTIYPEDPPRVIERYKELTETHVVREVSASMAYVTVLNYKINANKARTINWVFWLLTIGIIAIFVFTIVMVLALGA